MNQPPLTGAERCARHRAKRIAAGRCTWCGRPSPPGRRVCPPCVAASCARKRRQRADRRAAGACTLCGAAGSAGPLWGLVTCEECLQAKQRAKERRESAKFREAA